MADVSNRRVGELLRILFDVLRKVPEGLQAKEAMMQVEQRVQLNEHERGHYANGHRRFEKIIRFATVDCVKAGWLVKNKGRWTLTEAGKDAYERFTDPEAFYARAAKLYREWKASQPDVVTSESASAPQSAGDSAKETTVTFENAEEQAWLEVEGFLRKMQPYDFQELVAALLRAMGYHIAWVAPPGKDGGTDIIALPDPLGTRPPRIKVQVKRQQDAVRVDVVRSFMAVLGDEDVGLFVATGGFTKDAAEEARTQERRRVTLLDLEGLFDLWVEYYPKLTDDARQRLPLRPIYFLAPDA
jgi:restriction system protein